jgi:hypothetical protein
MYGLKPKNKRNQNNKQTQPEPEHGSVQSNRYGSRCVSSKNHDMTGFKSCQTFFFIGFKDGFSARRCSASHLVQGYEQPLTHLVTRQITHRVRVLLNLRHAR